MPCETFQHSTACDAESHLGLQALNDTPRVEAEWILWMDLDTIAVESDIALPLESYAGKDLVLWILPDEVLEGNPMRKLLLQCCLGSSCHATMANSLL